MFASALWEWHHENLVLLERHVCFKSVDVLTCCHPCHAAFEATRFYNVSENSPLARELCDGPTCNEVESSNTQWTGEPLVQTSQPPYVH